MVCEANGISSLAGMLWENTMGTEENSRHPLLIAIVRTLSSIAFI